MVLRRTAATGNGLRTSWVCLSPNPGDYVIEINTDNETTFKRLVKDGGNLYLKMLNSRYPIKPLGTARIIVAVREFTKRFR